MASSSRLQSAKSKLISIETELERARRECADAISLCRKTHWADMPEAGRMIGAGISIRLPAPKRMQDPAEWIESVRETLDSVLERLQEKAESMAEEIEEMKQIAEECYEEINSGEIYSADDYIPELRKFGMPGGRLGAFLDLSQSAAKALKLIEQKLALEEQIEDMEYEEEEE